jgi:NADPH:quinone reductase
VTSTRFKAVVAHAFGPPETFVLESRDRALPGPGKVRVAVHAAGISFVDVLIAAGEYQVKPPLPFVPGSEFSGLIDAVGDGVDPARIGERVCAGNFGMAFAESAVVNALQTFAIPPEMSFAEASVFRVSYATAYHALVQRGRLQAGETVLVLGAAGAVGAAAIEVAKALGARVIASASTEDKRALALRAGADAVVNARAADWREAVRAANDGRGVDIVVDPVGGSASEPAFRSLAWNGRHLVIGFAEGTIARIPTNRALIKGTSLVGVDVRQFGELEPVLAAANLAALFELYGAGKLKPAIARSYPLAEFAAAMVEAKSGRIAGRTILTMV